MYTISSPELEIIFDEFFFTNTECTDIVFTYTITVNGSSTLPSFIEYEGTLRSIWIQTFDTNFAGFYRVDVRGTIFDGTYDSTFFIVEITSAAPVSTPTPISSESSSSTESPISHSTSLSTNSP